MAIVPQEKKIKDTPEVKFDNIENNAPFPDDYQEICYRIWYGSGKVRMKELLEIIPEDEFGRKPNMSTINKWKREWIEKTEKLDLVVQKKTEELFVQERVDMFVQHAAAGAEMIDMGLDYLEEHGITTDSVAIRAIKEGSDLERKSLGIDELLKKISTMSDTQLRKRHEELAEDEDVVDAEWEDTDG